MDPAAPRLYKERRATQTQHLVNQIAADLGVDPRRVRLWAMVNRQNKTVRPDHPIVDLQPTVEETFQRNAARGDSSLRVWAEVTDDIDAKGHAAWPTYQGQPTGVIPNDLVLLFLKCFDAEAQTLRGVGHVYISKEKKVEELVPIIMMKMGWGERLRPDQKILLWEVRSHHTVLGHR